MPSCRFILCEKNPRWAAAFRAVLFVGCVKAGAARRNAPPSQKTQIIETRSLPGCEEALAASPASCVAIEITAANLEPTLEVIRRVAAHYPNALVVALLSPDTLAAAPLLREAGAIDVAASALDAPRLIRLAQRHHRQAPTEPLTARQFVAERLPWPSHATSASPIR